MAGHMDFEDFNEMLRTTARTLSSLRAANPESDEAKALQQKYTQLMAQRTKALGGSRGDMATPSHEQGFGRMLQQRVLHGEIQLLTANKIDGVFVRPTLCSPFAWDGLIVVSRGFYNGGVFKFRLLIPEHYPDTTVPRVIFQTNVYHPNIHPETGELDLSYYYKSWDRHKDRIWHVVKCTAAMFQRIRTTTPSNSLAATTYLAGQDTYRAAVQRCIIESKETAAECSPNCVSLDGSQDPKTAAKSIQRLGERLKSCAGHADTHAVLLSGIKSFTSDLPKAYFQSKKTSLVDFIKKSVSAPPTAAGFRLGGDKCSGYLTTARVPIVESQKTLLRAPAAEEGLGDKRYFMVDEPNSAITLYTNDSRTTVVLQLNTWNILRCYQPESIRAHDDHAFVVGEMLSSKCTRCDRYHVPVCITTVVSDIARDLSCHVIFLFYYNIYFILLNLILLIHLFS
eukprot:m.31097 g.31097  ORF g.31097 m.31097 type:complete len:453 (+) comp9375_c0_seq1:34-1392(+)